MMVQLAVAPPAAHAGLRSGRDRMGGVAGVLCAASAVDGVDSPEPISSHSELPHSRSRPLPSRSACPLSPSASRWVGRPCLRSCCDGARAGSCSWSSLVVPSAVACHASAASPCTSWSSLAASQLWACVGQPKRRRHRCSWMAAKTCSLVPMMPPRSSNSGADLQRPRDLEPPIGGDLSVEVRLVLTGVERCAGVPLPPPAPSLRRGRRNMVRSRKHWVRAMSRA